ncbi:DUF4166 domain-containing protein [Sporosarcina sp. BI001-red]|uniref:DUF4166 domain-containing protein n=1 Tax=Sporosarcina sp. BI001-red TaxID=2282866 RepID=UPI000E267EFE|nr:DUF4166 domain-containing protein [Sporosarcina sp. BI001-red]REB07458.1 DUF4166 domain-containing protein [Sporosarcina sp. BI001-red]
MSIYRKALADDFFRLHPMLQKRYAFDNPVFQASGTMHRISGGPKCLLPLFRLGARRKFVFPESGTDISFTIVNSSFTNSAGGEQVHWERKFSFPKKIRYFNALMSLDEQRMVVKDYLGEPPLFYSDLQFTVLDGGAMRIQSLNQRLILGRIEIPLPKLLQGLATVVESYDEVRRVFQIHVYVKNPLIGKVLSYEGEFIPDA